MNRGPRRAGTRHNNPLTDAERVEMQSMRDAGHSLSYIALAFDCGTGTVGQNTVAPPKKIDMSKRNAELLRRYEAAEAEERKFLARRYGFASVDSMVVTLSLYRRSLRLNGSARGETRASA